MNSEAIDAFDGFYFGLEAIVNKNPETKCKKTETRSLKGLIEGLEMNENSVVKNTTKELDTLLSDLTGGSFIHASTLYLLASQIKPLLRDENEFEIVP